MTRGAAAAGAAPKHITVAVQGCAHGELDNIYSTIEHLRNVKGVPIDLLLCCGDFQAVRNEADLTCMAVPDKYRTMNSFWKYYSGKETAPVPTVFVGGNHEASNYLWDLSFGGLVAPRIYYLGLAGVINFRGLRIGGLSGIFKDNDYRKGHFERAPYDNSALRSVYHVREYDVHKLLCVSEPVDVFLSHDWPRGIAGYGDKNRLLSKKPFFRQEVESNTLGSPPAEEILHCLRPSYWFSAHLHVKFAALVRHPRGMNSSSSRADQQLPSPGLNSSDPSASSSPQHLPAQGAEVKGSDPSGGGGHHMGGSSHREQQPPSPGLTSSSGGGRPGKGGEASGGPAEEPGTRFLALDKCLPGRDFLQVVRIPVRPGSEGPRQGDEFESEFEYDEEWLAITRAYAPYFPLGRSGARYPPAGVALEPHRQWVREAMRRRGSLAVQESSFHVTVPPYSETLKAPPVSGQQVNPQTSELLDMLGLPVDLLHRPSASGIRLDDGSTFAPEESAAGILHDPNEIELGAETEEEGGDDCQEGEEDTPNLMEDDTIKGDLSDDEEELDASAEHATLPKIAVGVQIEGDVAGETMGSERQDSKAMNSQGAPETMDHTMDSKEGSEGHTSKEGAAAEWLRQLPVDDLQD